MPQQKPNSNNANAKNESQYYEDEIDIVDYIKVIYKHRWMIMIIVLISMFFVGVFSLMKPKMYEASATFFPMNTDYNIQSQGVVMKPRLDMEDLIISILESRKMADRIIEQLDLKKVWNKKLTTDARRKLDKASNISLDKNGIIKLSVQTGSPELSSKIANAYVDNLDYFNKELNLGANRQVVQVIDRATVPEERMSRGTVTKVLLATIVSFMFSVFLAFLVEFIQKSGIKNKLIGG